MDSLYRGFCHRGIFCQIHANVTIQSIERAFLNPPLLRLNLQRWHNDTLISSVLGITPHIYEWQQSINPARQIADSPRLNQFLQWLIEQEQPERRGPFFIFKKELKDHQSRNGQLP